MTFPTCNVVCTIFSAAGRPVPNAVITAKLDRVETYLGFVIPQTVMVTTDALGQAVLALWPNELGTTGSFYTIRIKPPVGGSTTVTAVVPNVDTIALHLIAGLPSYAGMTEGQLMLSAAVEAGATAVAEAAHATTSAAEALLSQNAAAQSEGVASGAASVASTQAGNAEISATNSDSSAASASASAIIAVDKAAIATNQASAAELSASAALASQGSATTQASNAATSAQAAEDSATQAALSRDGSALSAQAASDSAGVALGQANAASLSSINTAALLASFRSVYLGAFADDASANSFAAIHNINVVSGVMYENTVENKFQIFSNDGVWVDYDASATVSQAQATLSAGNAAGSASAALFSENSAFSSAESADSNATLTAADVVLTHADVLTAANHATSAGNSALTATEQAEIATTQAGLLNSETGIATTQAGISTAQAVISTDQATIATEQAIAASASAEIALNAVLDTETLVSLAESNQNNASVSESAALESSVQADLSRAQAGTSANNASSSALDAHNDALAAASSASTASSDALATSGDATNASQSATDAANSAISAASSAGAATVGGIRFDTAQTLTAPEKVQALSNIGAALVAGSGSYSDLTNKPVIPVVGVSAQAWGADLDAIVGIGATSGLLKKTATHTWALDTNTYLSSITYGQVTAALGFTPYDNANPNVFTANLGTVTSVAGTGSVSGLTLSGSISNAGALTLGGALSLSNSEVIAGLGFTPENVATKGAANGYAPLGVDSKVAAIYLPSYVDDVLEFADLASFPVTGEASKIYTAIDTSKIYRWSGSVYVIIAASPGSSDAVSEGVSNLYFTVPRARAAISASGSINYNDTTGVFSYTAPTYAAVASSGAYSDLTGQPTLATVAGTGAYADLTGQPIIPTVPTALSAFTNDSGYTTPTTVRTSISVSGNLDYSAGTGVISYTAPTLATVASTGAYSDLINKPTIPAAQVNSDWNAVSGLAVINNKPTLFLGSYVDLSNKPTTLSGYGITDAQATLVSSTNIKTINGTSVLGSGDIVIASGGRVSGTSYVYVAGDSTAANNGTVLLAAYTAASALTPYGAALSATNRVAIVVGSGQYTTTGFTLSSQFVDLVSLTGGPDVFLSAISVTANDVFIKGMNLGSASFTIARSLTLLKVENCTGGDASFSSSTLGIYAGTFTNCIGGANSFGGSSSSFATGTFINCKGGFNSFGGYGGTASGTFVNCIGGAATFASGGTASGTFTNCIGEGQAFAGGGTASGTFTNCVGGSMAFAAYGTASGTFTNSIGGSASFGGSSTLSGKLFYCRLKPGSGAFSTVSSGGRTYYCVDGNGSVNNQ